MKMQKNNNTPHDYRPRKHRRRQKQWKKRQRPIGLVNAEMRFLRRISMAHIAPFDLQVQVGFYFPDFVFPTKMLVVEIDGSSHLYQQEYDDRRTRFLNDCGFTVWRILNAKVDTFPLARLRELPDHDPNLYHQALRYAHELTVKSKDRERPQRPEPLPLRPRLIKQGVDLALDKDRS